MDADQTSATYLFKQKANWHREALLRSGVLLPSQPFKRQSQYNNGKYACSSHDPQSEPRARNLLVDERACDLHHQHKAPLLPTRCRLGAVNKLATIKGSQGRGCFHDLGHRHGV